MKSAPDASSRGALRESELCLYLAPDGQIKSLASCVNDVLYTHAAPETPWGGVKESGVGRVHSDEGLRGLCEGYHINYPVVSTGKSELFWYPYSGSRYKLLRNVTRGLFSSGLGQKLNGFLGK